MQRKLILIVCLLSIFPPSYSSGDKFEIKGILSPTFETMRPGNRLFKDDWGYKLSYNFGLEYKYYLKPDISFSTGILYQDKGYRSVYSENKNPSLLYNNSIFITSFEYFMIPTNLNIHFETSTRSRFLLVMGLTNGYLWKAKASYKRVSDDELNLIKDGSSDLDPEDNSYDMVPYSYRRFTGANLGFKFSKYIKSKMIIEFGAIYSRQLNRVSRVTEAADVLGNYYYIKPKFDAFIFDIRLGYFFNKQIKNSGKDF